MFRENLMRRIDTVAVMIMSVLAFATVGIVRYYVGVEAAQNSLIVWIVIMMIGYPAGRVVYLLWKRG